MDMVHLAVNANASIDFLFKNPLLLAVLKFSVALWKLT